MTIAELKEKYPNATKVIENVAIVAGAAVACYIFYVNGIRIEVTTLKDREIRKVDFGRAQNILNGVHGAQARGFDTSKGQAEYDSIIAPYM